MFQSLCSFRMAERILRQSSGPMTYARDHRFVVNAEKAGKFISYNIDKCVCRLVAQVRVARAPDIRCYGDMVIGRAVWKHG